MNRDWSQKGKKRGWEVRKSLKRGRRDTVEGGLTLRSSKDASHHVAGIAFRRSYCDAILSVHCHVNSQVMQERWEGPEEGQGGEKTSAKLPVCHQEEEGGGLRQAHLRYSASLR